MTDPTKTTDGRDPPVSGDFAPPDTDAPRPLTDAARRALAEAKARRAQQDANAARQAMAPEINGRGGPEPVRYGDWENKGIASDF